MIPRAMTLVVQEGIEPLLIGEALRRSCTACACPPSPTSEQRGADVAGDCRERPQDNNHIGERRLSARRPSARPAAEDREEIRGRDQVSSSFRKKKPSRAYARPEVLPQELTRPGRRGLFFGQPVFLQGKEAGSLWFPI